MNKPLMENLETVFGNINATMDRLERERDAAQALVETHEATIAQRDERITELEAAISRAERVLGKRLNARETHVKLILGSVSSPLPFETRDESDHAPMSVWDELDQLREQRALAATMLSKMGTPEAQDVLRVMAMAPVND